MNRRSFVKRTASTALAGAVAGSFPAMAGNLLSTGMDKFGGWTGKKFKATGFFRVEKDDRWWIVTPEGNAFLSFGINHLVPDLFSQDYQREQWEKVFSIKDISNWEAYRPALRKWYLQSCKDFGFNTVGVHNSLQVINIPKPELAYMQPIHFVDIPHWKKEIPDENFKDIFSSDFARECDEMAKPIVLAKKDDPYLFAYAMTDCPLFTEEDLQERPDTIGGGRRKARIGWPRRLRNLGGDAPGKQAYVLAMQKIYEDRISKFNETYGTQFVSFDGLASAKNWRPDTDLSNGNESEQVGEGMRQAIFEWRLCLHHGH
jgi:hypothetical protein